MYVCIYIFFNITFVYLFFISSPGLCAKEVFYSRSSSSQRGFTPCAQEHSGNGARTVAITRKCADRVHRCIKAAGVWYFSPHKGPCLSFRPIDLFRQAGSEELAWPMNMNARFELFECKGENRACACVSVCGRVPRTRAHVPHLPVFVLHSRTAVSDYASGVHST